MKVLVASFSSLSCCWRLLPLLPVPSSGSPGQLHRPVFAGGHRLVLLTGVAGLTTSSARRLRRHGRLHGRRGTSRLTHGVSPWLTVWVGPGLHLRCALVLGWITLRMSGHYLPLATIAWGLACTTCSATWVRWASTTACSAFRRSVLRPHACTGRSCYLLLWLIVLLAASARSACSIRAPAAPRACRQGRRPWPRQWASTRRLKDHLPRARGALLAACRAGCSRISSAR